MNTISVSAALLIENNRLLISLRRDGFWEFPGGKMEPGETPAQALVRELEEELEITVAAGQVFSTIEHAYPDRRVRLYFIVCRTVAGRPRAVGVETFKWVAGPELAGYDFLEADRSILAELAATDLSDLEMPAR